MRFDGVLKTWNDDRGFGFIEPSQGGDEVFVHIKAFGPRSGRPQVNQRLSFELELGPQGKKRATNVQAVRVTRAPVARSRDSPAQWGTATLFAIPAFVIVYVVVSAIWRTPLLLAAAYAAASGVTFIAYAIDKSAAEGNRWRTPESTLHLLALLGGWPGALLAQQFFRHKSSKAEFRAAFWGTVILNVVAFVVFCSPIGKSIWTPA